MADDPRDPPAPRDQGFRGLNRPQRPSDGRRRPPRAALPGGPAEPEARTESTERTPPEVDGIPRARTGSTGTAPPPPPSPPGWGPSTAGPATQPADGPPTGSVNGATAALPPGATAPYPGSPSGTAPSGAAPSGTAPSGTAPSGAAPSWTSGGPRYGTAAPGAPPTTGPPPSGPAGPGPGGPTTGTPPVAPAQGVAEVNLAVWGATESGKSTMLLALPTAAEARGWKVFSPEDGGESDRYLSQARNEFAEDLLLPLATQDEASIVWKLRRDAERPGRIWSRRRPALDVTLRTIDRAGGDFHRRSPADVVTAAVENLLGAHGIVYLFDPRRELRRTESGTGDGGAAFFNDCLDRLFKRAHQEHRLTDGGKLPHGIAVCVTKFDSPRIFQLACEGGFVTQDQRSPRQPRVADAAGFFEFLCESYLGGSARQLRQQIQASFVPARIRYFVCSSIGFRCPRGVFDPSQNGFDNLHPQKLPGRDGMYEHPRPVNVLEPFVELARAVAPARP